ncbi:MAG: hypothetical protein HY986_21800 [Candidatus Melainabacteria bacterium]|nr:hypothetical protein [Candidatus Melainabacteria bacterium]
MWKDCKQVCLGLSISGFVLGSVAYCGSGLPAMAQLNVPLLTIKKHVQDRVVLKEGRYRILVNEGKGWRAFQCGLLRAGKIYRTTYPDFFSGREVPARVATTEEERASLSKPTRGECVLHILNEESRFDYVRFKIEPLGGVGVIASTAGSAKTTVPTAVAAGSAFDGTWHTRRQHQGCCSYSADEDYTFKTLNDGTTVVTAGGIPLKGKVVGSTFSFTYGSGRSGSFVLAPDGKSFSGSFTDLESNHRGNFSGSR